MARNNSTFMREEDGAITTEFVIIFPVVMALLFLIVFISLLIAAVSDVQQIAHDLARSSFRHLGAAEPPADICSVLAAEALPGLVVNSLLLSTEKLAVMPCPGQPDPGGYFTISVNYTFAGDAVQSIGETFGIEIGTVTRSSTTYFR